MALSRDGMFLRRSSILKRLALGVSTLFLICYLYYFLNDTNYAWYTWGNRKHQCKTPESEMQDLQSLARKTHRILGHQNLTHFLVYGSLWGAIRYSNPLPWDNDVDIGILADELLKIDEASFMNKFQEEGISIFYRPYFGAYRVRWKNARGDLMIFQDYYRNGVMNRVGYESYIFFINYRSFHNFPAHLIQSPLPTSKFAGEDFPVPRYGNEIQKYHYRNDWWKESKPKGC